ncbi:hypothetical protein Q5H93_03685 [Hymenobacter sp. ASUV-10]|uniref:Uncharacterized protein n=1 Tax=Hymenobacter aranciens TaxID=3063996 RepID=A0ABT9BAU4_9BACT|nr:hypothetical protein [Hymenobacter sp. ASUV-10]MDO7873821.1 hypothetical protein [Hymenobacter sp. ASUV-10]
MPPPPPATVAQCRQQLLDRLKSGAYALFSADKEGSRTLCYFRGTFLRAAVGDEGTSLLRLPTDEHLLGHVWQLAGPLLELVEGRPQWRYDLTPAEELAQWQQQLARLQPFSPGQQQFVARVLAEFASLAGSPG